jgi:amino acid adenylation domain-containing protein
MSVQAINQAGLREAQLSYEQEQLWLSHQLNPAAAPDLECAMVTLPGNNLDAGALRQSLGEFVQRHEIWRTTFRPRGTRGPGGPVQVVQPGGDFAWSVRDLSGLAHAEAEAGARRYAQADAQSPFDLARGPLVRALLVRLSPDEHRLYLTVHRIVGGWVSLAEVFGPELRALYEARVQGRETQLRPAGQQYADYARWQRSRPGERTRHLEFWAEYLAGAPTVLDLPADHRRPEQPGTRAGVQPFALGAELTAGLRELSRRQQVPLQATLTAALAALLYRYTGQEDLLIGKVSEDAPQRPGRPVMGCFLNTVVHRADLTGDPTVRELLRRTDAASREVRPHQDMPFDAVVRELRPERTLGRPPLVQVALAVTAPAPAAGAPWELTRVPLEAPAPKLDLLVEAEVRADGLSGRFVYQRGLFEPETIRRMTRHWRLVLEGMVAAPDRSVSDLELLTEPERAQLRQWGTGGPVPAGPDVGELIEAQAGQHPDALAVVCEGEQLSYRELHTRASQLARYLRGHGVGPGVAVGVCLERSAGQVVALLAILRAGGVYVPVDPQTPAERVRYVVRDTGMPLLLTQRHLQKRLAGSGTRVLGVDGGAAFIPQPRQQQVVGADWASQPAYIIYTSGSTGQPKGVVVERGALSAHCRAMIDVYGLTPQDRVLQFSQYSFDASLEQILPALAAGARLVVRGEELWSPRQLLREVQHHQVTVLNLPSAYWQQVVREWAQVRSPRAGTPGALAGTRLLNAYGPTETTITATLAEIQPDDEWITIGRPLPGRTAHILDRKGRPVPAGVVGELYLGGDLLARGYLNQPELTSERFGPDSFAADPGARLYRTGDRGRYLADGRIDYVGREDQQVKIRGYRIELGEVEAALAQHPDVAQAVVVARPAGRGSELAAFVVAEAGTGARLDQAGLAGLRRFLREQLPAYMVPPVIEPLADLPRLANGKPDRRRLQQGSRGSGRPGEGYVAPRLPVHEQLAGRWEELLEVRPVGISDNFFDLGGHSLLAAQLVDRIEQRYGKKLALSELFAGPTIEQLAARLEDVAEAARPAKAAEAAGGPGEDRASRVVLRPVQESGTRTPFFFLHGDWTGGAFYCFALARAAGPDQPFYVLEPYVFSDTEPVPSMEAVAAAHLRALRAVQPHGPYRLGGFCNGGLLAYEMARQLERDGEQIEFLGLVNPSSPLQRGSRQRLADRVYQLLHVPDSAQLTAYLRGRHALRHVYRKVRPAGERVEDFGKLLVIEPRLAAAFPAAEALYRDYVGVFNWLAGRYRTGHYAGPMTFYWAREILAEAQSWWPLIRLNPPAGREQRTIEGALMSSVTEHVEGLAGQLRDDLDQARLPSSQATILPSPASA